MPTTLVSPTGDPTLKTRWEMPEPRPELEASFVRELDVHPLLARLLVNRDVCELEAARQFLAPTPHALHDPWLLKDMDRAVDRITTALERRQRITIYSDYDVDGVTGTAILFHFFALLGLPASTYVPERRSEGYGLNTGAIERIEARGCDLLITVDCGIRGVEPVREAMRRGIDVIVTDHHEPDDELPPALAVIDPKRSDCDYPFGLLCGAGVAFKLAWAVAQRLSGVRQGKVKDAYRQYLIDAMGLAAMGTIADVVPLFGENRILASWGLRCLPTTKFVGLAALIEASELSGKPICAEDVGYRLGPRLNAAGRMGSASRALELLTTSDPSRGKALAVELETENRTRRNVEGQIVKAALAQIEALGLDRHEVLVVAGDDWHPGVVGIVASRLVDRFHRPAVVIGMDGETGRGSARTMPEYHILDALLACREHTERVGGHARAAGFEIRRDQLEAFREALQAEVARTITPEQRTPKLYVDAEAALSDLTPTLIDALRGLEPTGEGNPPVVLVSRDVEVVNAPRQVGGDGKHLQLWVRQQGYAVKVIGFGFGKDAARIQAGDRIGLAYTPKIDTFRGQQQISLHLEDWAPGGE